MKLTKPMNNIAEMAQVVLATILVATVMATVSPSSVAVAEGDFVCSTSATSEGTLLSWNEVAPDTTYYIRFLIDGENDYLFSVAHSAGDPAPSSLVPYSFGTYRVINYVDGRATTDCVAPDGTAQPPFVCSVGTSEVNWNRINASKYSVRLAIAPTFDRFLANTQNTSSPAPSQYGVYTVIARDGGVVDTATCTGPSGAQPPPFECTIDGSGLSWTDQGVSRYYVRRLISGGSVFVGSATTPAYSGVDPNGQYEVIFRIRGIRFSAPCDNPLPNPCDEVGQFIALELNDRCAPGEGQDIVWEDVLQSVDTGIWITSVCSDVLVTAMPDQVLVTVDLGGDAGQAADRVRRRLVEAGIGSTTDPDDVTQLARIVTVEGAEPEEILQLLPLLQGEGYSADLNYLEPLAPNNFFRPFDNPTPADEPTPGGDLVGEGASVLVVDSTADLTQYDLDGNGLVDEDHGHGAFVASIIRRAAPAANVVLAGVDSSAPRLNSGRWAPMMFSDYDIITAMEAEVLFNDGQSFDLVNMSLGGAGCIQSSLGIGIGERIALGRAMRAIATPGESTIVAAAGNAGIDAHHFPAAWRDPDAVRELIMAVEAEGDVAAAADIADLFDFFRSDRLIAVGSGDTDGNRDAFSNCGEWVNAIAAGADQIGEYPASPTGYAAWSGTSFSTPNLVASLLGGDPKVAYPISGLSC